MNGERPSGKAHHGRHWLRLAVLVLAACGAEEGSIVSPDPRDSGTSLPPPPLRNPDVGDPGDAACATSTTTAERLPLDLVLMLDASGSMEEELASGDTKWNAVKDALLAFFRDPSSTGIGTSLAFFPANRPGVPAECTADQACGAFGPCERLRVCTGYSALVPCARDGDCGGGGRTCVLLGTCSANQLLCGPAGGTCGGQNGAPAGMCVAVPGSCAGREMCELAAYQAPAVQVTPLPQALRALGDALDARQPDGRTPTAPALSGAIELARVRARARPERRVAVVLATDGFPTTCPPIEIPSIASLARAAATGAPAVSTFVIGVFSPDEQEQATSNLNAIAAAGGTGRAYVLSTKDDVRASFRQALERIRTTGVACDFALPSPKTGETLDPFRVNVEMASGGGAGDRLPYVGSAAGCAITRGFGWYYERDAAGAPVRIMTCPTTCGSLRADLAASVRIVVGCSTWVLE